MADCFVRRELRTSSLQSVRKPVLKDWLFFVVIIRGGQSVDDKWLWTISEFPNIPRVLFGPGCSIRIGDELQRLGVEQVLVVVDGGVLKSDDTNVLLEKIAASVKHFAIFDKVVPDPSTDTVEEAFSLASRISAEAIVAIGGGSSIDTAKIVSILMTNGGKILDWAGKNKFSTPPTPLIAVPTTAGTGSEMSSHAVVTDKTKGTKYTIIHTEYNKPKLSVLDPKFLRTCPPYVIAETGVDAFAHAFEAFISREAGPFVEFTALKAIQLIAQSVRPLYADRTNMQAAGRMLLASALAGSAFAALTGAGNAHCIARCTGPAFGLSHGLAVATALPHVADYNMMAVPEKYLAIAKAIVDIDATTCGQEATPSYVPELIRSMCKDLGLPSGLRTYSPSDDAIEGLAQASYKAYRERYEPSNPRMTALDDFRTIMQAICSS